MREDVHRGQDLLSVAEVAVHGDSRSYRTYPFTVPPGTTALNLTFDVEPEQVGPYRQAVGVALYGPGGFRGIPGRSAPPFRIAADGAAPGFRPGPIEAGAWLAQVSLGYVLDGPPCAYRLRVWAEPAPGKALSDPIPELPAAVAGTGPRWYAGELHMHTYHSDGHRTVSELWQAVQRRRLDFFVLTDHNNLCGQAEVAALDAGAVLPIPGMEVTTLEGHLLAIGVATPIDWRLHHEGRSISAIVRDIHAAGGLAIIAHPGAAGSPFCHGCRWDLADVDPGEIDAVEVWNSPWHDDHAASNERSLAFWEAWLARGYRVPLTCGSDAHEGGPSFAPGVPKIYVYARKLSRAAILDGIRAGRVVVSSGPALRLDARAGEQTGGPGETLPAQGPLTIEATVAELTAPAQLRLIGNGAVLAAHELHADGTYRHVIARPASGWYRAELRGLDGAMLAMTSPLYVA